MNDSRRTDGDTEAERALVEMLRAAPVWKRAEQLAGLIHARRVLILADLRRRYPRADAESWSRCSSPRLS